MVSTKKATVGVAVALLVTAIVTASQGQPNNIPVPPDIEKAVLARLTEIQSAAQRSIQTRFSVSCWKTTMDPLRKTASSSSPAKRLWNQRNRDSKA